MNPNDYKAAFDSAKFSENFEQETIEFLTRAADAKLKKENHMKTHKIMRAPILIAAFIAVLTISAVAAFVLLSPKEVAAQAGNTALAEAFDSAEAIIINQSAQSGEYTITLGGIVSGKGLADYCEEAQEDKSYIVASVAYTDGREIAQVGETGMTFTPLVESYKPWQINAWTLNGGYSSFLHKGVNYYIFECSNIEIFADHTVYLAAYEGGAPSAEIFMMDKNGEISFTESFSAPHAIFTLPLDPSKADSQAVNKVIESVGLTIQ